MDCDHTEFVVSHASPQTNARRFADFVAKGTQTGRLEIAVAGDEVEALDGVPTEDPISDGLAIGDGGKVAASTIHEFSRDRDNVRLMLTFGSNPALIDLMFANSIASENGVTRDLEFMDGSVATVHPTTTPAGKSLTVRWDVEELPPRARLDVGLSLLEPVTTQEIGAVEQIMSVLSSVAASGSIQPEDEQRVLDAIKEIREEARLAEPGSTGRWKLIGALRPNLRNIASVVTIANQGPQLVEKLIGAGWGAFADEVARWLADAI